MSWNFKKELIRKAIHVLTVGILIIYAIAADTYNPKTALLILTFILIISLEFEYLRIEIGRKIPILGSLWALVRRKKEKDKIGGDVFFIIGAILVLAIFDIKVAFAAILMTTFGDMAAALIGTRYGKHYITKNKAWEGIIAEFVVNIAIGALIFLTPLISQVSISLNHSLIIIAVMAITATFVETIVSKMDDNLLIPLFAGFNGHITLLILNTL